MPMTPPKLRRRGRVMLAVGVLVASASGLTACGSSAPPVPPPLSRAAMESGLQQAVPGQNKAERAIDRAAGTVLPGDGKDGLVNFQKELAKLKGTAVVVNLWGDWCTPCQKEIPVFQRVALAQRGKAAFLGVATFSKRAKTEKYLATKKWLPYPSVLDDDGQVARTTAVNKVPQTIFYTPAGKKFVHIGPYESVAELTTDIARYTK
jgi:thiol-disulfide isomerase/thioredoxin